MKLSSYCLALISIIIIVSVDTSISLSSSWTYNGEIKRNYTLPQANLRQALAFVGNNHRLRLLVHRLLSGDNGPYRIGILGGSISTMYKGYPHNLCKTLRGFISSGARRKMPIQVKRILGEGPSSEQTQQAAAAT